MFSWLKNWFGKDRPDLYNLRERLIYNYFNGQKIVRADPMVLYKRMMDKGPELSIDIKVSSSQSKDAQTAHNAMVQKIRDIFTIKPFEEGGLSEIETIALLDHFMVYLESLKKSIRPSLTSSPPLEQVRNASSDDAATNSSSLSGSAENKSSTVKLEQSLSVPG